MRLPQCGFYGDGEERFYVRGMYGPGAGWGDLEDGARNGGALSLHQLGQCATQSHLTLSLAL